MLKHLPQAGRARGLPRGTILATCGLSAGLLSCVFLVTVVRALLSSDWESPRAWTVSPWSGRELTAGGSTVFPIRLVAPQGQSYVHSQQRGLPQSGPPPIFPPRWELPKSKGYGSFIKFSEPLGGRAKSPVLTRGIPRARKCPSHQIDVSPSQEFLRAQAMSPPQLESSLMVGIMSPSSERRPLR